MVEDAGEKHSGEGDGCFHWETTPIVSGRGFINLEEEERDCLPHSEL